MAGRRVIFLLLPQVLLPSRCYSNGYINKDKTLIFPTSWYQTCRMKNNLYTGRLDVLITITYNVTFCVIFTDINNYLIKCIINLDNCSCVHFVTKMSRIFYSETKSIPLYQAFKEENKHTSDYYIKNIESLVEACLLFFYYNCNCYQYVLAPE